MTFYSPVFARFQDAILANDASIVLADIKPSGHLSVYIDGYRMRMVQAVRADYPALESLLGTQEFERLARAFVEANPSTDFNLDRYPGKFCAFLPSQGINGFALEVTQLESAIAEIFMGPESTPAGKEVLAGLTAASLSALSLKPRSASRLMKFGHPVNTWLLNQRAEKNPSVPVSHSSFLFVYRHNNNVKRVELQEAEYFLLEQFCTGKSLEDALEQAVINHPSHTTTILDNVQLWFSSWLSQGFFSK